MAKKKMLASVSLDLDDQWSYMKVHGDDGWETFPSYLDIVVPVFLDVFDKLDIKITFFVVATKQLSRLTFCGIHTNSIVSRALPSIERN